MIESILADFEKYYSVTPIKGKNDSEGFYILPVSEIGEVWVKGLDRGFYMRSIICPMIRPKDPEDFFIYLMKANFIGQGTGGSVINLDPDEKFIYLSQSVYNDVNYAIFRDKLEDFLNYLDYWKEGIKEQAAK